MQINKKMFLLASISIISLCGCGSNESNNNSNQEEVKNGFVRGKILADNGNSIIAGIIIKDSEGSTKRVTTNALGAYDISLTPGKYTLTFTKGYEFSLETKEIEVESLKKLYLQDVRLTQLYDSYASGWVAGDLHQHTYYSDGQDSVQSLLLSNISQGLYYGFLSDHNVARGTAEWYNAKYFSVFTDSDGDTRYFSPFEAVEETTEFGHYQSLGSPLVFDKYDVELYASERNSAKKNEIVAERIKYICDEIKRSGAVAQINHPYSVSTMGFNNWELTDLFDTVEIWNGNFPPCDGRYEKEGQNYKSKMKWFDCLNKGIKLSCTGGTDNHDTSSPEEKSDVTIDKIDGYETYNEYYASLGKYSGMPTTYLNLDVVNKDNVLTALKDGNAFVSNGPVIDSNVNGVSYGETYALGTEDPTLNINLFNRDGLESYQIVKNGEIVKSVTLNKEMNYKNNVVLEDIKANDWIVLEAFGKGTEYAITNPIYFK